MSECVVLNTEEQIRFYQLASLKARLKIEMKGLKFRGRTAYSLAKQLYGLKGNRDAVLAELCRMVDEELQKKWRNDEAGL